MVRAHATAAGSSELLATMEGVTQALFGGADPKATVRKWKADMRGEQRKLDRQIRGVPAARMPPHAPWD